MNNSSAIRTNTNYKVTIRLYLTVFVFGLCFLPQGEAQAKNDYHWILGYLPNKPEEYFGGVSIDFDKMNAEANYFNTQSNANEPAVLSSNSGRLLAYSDGCNLYNANHEIMANGDSIAFGQVWEQYCYLIGYPGDQHHLLLPWPGDTNKAMLLYLKLVDGFTTHHLLYATIEFTEANPLGIVIEKDKYLIDPGITALLTATKHANGRDWWVILPEAKTNSFYILLLSPNGITVFDKQSIGQPVGDKAHSSQAMVTPDGKKYIRFNPWKGLDIMDFDRCNGTLSNIVESGPFSNPIKLGGGVASSIDSRFLYVSNNQELYQFDLTNPNILSTKFLLGTYDGYGDPLPTTFYHMQLAPDGKIYIFSTNGVRSLHVINSPSKKNELSNFSQHSFQLPAFIKIGAPVIPYFRLGPDDLSPCDTLGINNTPIAFFNYVVDSTNNKKIIFTNLSYFEPQLFNWEFGDGQTSSLRDPDFIEYNSTGSYEICLTVSNFYGSDTYCKILIIGGTTSASEPAESDTFIIHPNPFNSNINIIANSVRGNFIFSLYAADGRLVMRKALSGSDQVEGEQFSEGLYFYTISRMGKNVQIGKVLKYK